MRPRRPDTVLMALPNGQKVRVWRKDVAAISADIARTGDVYLRRPEGAEVYERVDPHSLEIVEFTKARRIASGD